MVFLDGFTPVGYNPGFRAETRMMSTFFHPSPVVFPHYISRSPGPERSVTGRIGGSRP